jgi:hypothetical protein
MVLKESAQGPLVKHLEGRLEPYFSVDLSPYLRPYLSLLRGYGNLIQGDPHGSTQSHEARGGARGRQAGA